MMENYPTIYPEPHILGEFPMSCYKCHVEFEMDDEPIILGPMEGEE